VGQGRAGKSHLQDAILSLCPNEDLIKLTSVSDKALFYKGENALAHKVLALEEEAGASGAHYAIRNLISSRKLVIETTVKNSLTGKMETQVNTVRGPTAIFQTTTNPDTDAETKSRFLVLGVDESSEQTRAILEAQRNRHTLEGHLQRKQREEVLARHHSFQRMLKPLTVINPFEPFLAYEGDRLSHRRDNPKYLNLILAVTFLHQMQREVKNHPEIGSYIEVTLHDIETAHKIAQELFAHSLDDLSVPSRRLWNLIVSYVQKKASSFQNELTKFEFSRRELREAFHWGEYQLRIHINQLVSLGYLAKVSGKNGLSYSYRLAFVPTENQAPAYRFKSIEQIEKEVARALRGDLVGTSLDQENEVKEDVSPMKSSVRNKLRGLFQGI
jgi:DNA primase